VKTYDKRLLRRTRARLVEGDIQKRGGKEWTSAYARIKKIGENFVIRRCFLAKKTDTGSPFLALHFIAKVGGKKAPSCDNIYWEPVCCRWRFVTDFIGYSN
jgi:hypothetical protein